MYSDVYTTIFLYKSGLCVLFHFMFREDCLGIGILSDSFRELYYLWGNYKLYFF